MENKKDSRRSFIKKTAIAATTLYPGGILPGFSAKSYKRIIGSNELARVSVMGVNSRGLALAQNFAAIKNCEVSHVCDVDSRAIDKAAHKIYEVAGSKAKKFKDFRKSLEDKGLDALVVATPDHWHAPATLMGLKAGKHVYVEKPCSHNPGEGEILVEAVNKYGKIVQMGNQRRSYNNVIQAIQEIKSGAIGKAYYGKGWYASNRESIGVGKKIPVPEWLDWDLWQGPAPRKSFKDIYVHYNWHWFWHWGTGEALNNGTHMVDLLRWGLGVDYPIRVSSNGGRYHYSDDQETPDTQIISMDFKEGISLSWEGLSCNGIATEGTPVGAMFYGTKGGLLISGKNSYTIFGLKGEVIKEVKDDQINNALAVDRANWSAASNQPHIINFLNAIKSSEPLHSDIVSSHKSTLLVQLANIAQRIGHSLEINPEDGHILNDKEALGYWSRTYEKGWEMKL